MGRPKKHPHANNPDEASITWPFETDGDYLQDMDSTWQQASVVSANHTPMDLDMDLGGTAAFPMESSFNADMGLRDYLGPGFIPAQPLQTSDSLPHEMPIDQGLPNVNINFDPSIAPPSTNNIAPGTTPSELTYHTPSLSFQGTSPRDSLQDPDSATAPPPTTALPAAAMPSAYLPSSPCVCLYNLQHALASMHSLPEDITTAIQVARGACRTAHDAIQCPVCMPPTCETVKYPTVTFTTMMNLGSLLPCIADAYHRILAMIDAETHRAIASKDKSRLYFSLATLGGIWGTHHNPIPNPNGESSWQGSVPGTACADLLARFDQQDVDPKQWRLTLRALLKGDVNGLSGCDGGEGLTQVGLRDLVAQMDEKSRQRHAQIDQLLEAGLEPPVGLAGMRVGHSEVSTPYCRQVIALAREAVESIVIA